MVEIAAPPALITPESMSPQVLSAVVTSSSPPLMLIVWSKFSSAPAPRSRSRLPSGVDRRHVAPPSRPPPSRLKSGTSMFTTLLTTSFESPPFMLKLTPAPIVALALNVIVPLLAIVPSRGVERGVDRQRCRSRRRA